MGLDKGLDGDEVDGKWSLGRSVKAFLAYISTSEGVGHLRVLPFGHLDPGVAFG